MTSNMHYFNSLLISASLLEPDLKKRIRVHLLNAHGLDEAGIDGGGIFREFLNELLKSGFNPNQGFFKTTNEGLLYPNPAAEMLVGESFTRHYYFLGRILGKVSLRAKGSLIIHHWLKDVFCITVNSFILISLKDFRVRSQTSFVN